MKKIVSSVILIVLIIQIATITLATENNTINSEIEKKVQYDISNQDDTSKNYDMEIIGQTDGENEKINSQESSDDEIKWTDFSKAHITLSKDGTDGASVEVSEITPIENHTYILYISNSNNQNININDIDEDNLIYLALNKEKNKLTSSNNKIAREIELNQDLYGTIIDRIQVGKEKVVLSAAKLSRFNESQDYNAFFATHMTHDSTQIITTFTHNEKNTRKLQIKIGKITDNQILRKIQEKKESGFSDLMKYAKSQNNSLYDNVSVVENNPYGIRHVSSDEGSSVIKLNGLENKEYYYLYVKADDENGKYILNEAVTLAQSSVYEDGSWFLFFYGTNDFKWNDFGTISTKDPTEATGKYPFTGKIALGTGIVVLIGITYILHRKNTKYQDVK